jgi:fructose-1,6-bisphosphatase I
MPFSTTDRLVTIDHHISQEENLHPEATGDFSALLHDITFAIRIISRDVRRAGLNDILGLARKTNVHGEQVRKLDTYSNDVIKGALIKGGNVCVMASEENDDIIIPDNGRYGKYVVAFDPLDGSNNIDANVTIGTIFSVYKRFASTRI